MSIPPGLTNELKIIVQESDTARAQGGETLPPVLSTPYLVRYLERVAHTGLMPHLPAGQTSVGTIVNVKHLAATPVGMQVRFQAELMTMDGRRLVFKVEAWDEVEKIAEGEHERFIIDSARFDKRLAEKQAMIKPENNA